MTKSHHPTKATTTTKSFTTTKIQVNNEKQFSVRICIQATSKKRFKQKTNHRFQEYCRNINMPHLFLDMSNNCYQIARKIQRSNYDRTMQLPELEYRTGAFNMIAIHAETNTAIHAETNTPHNQNITTD